MALTVPKVDRLALHLRVEDISEAGFEEEWAQDALVESTDLMSMATDLEEDPDGDLAQRVMTRGIVSMAHYLLVNFDDREAQFSPFSSERIGSYSYSKQQARAAAASGAETGVASFDQAVAYIRGKGELSSAFWSCSTEVMGQTNPEDEPAPDPHHFFISHDVNTIQG